MHIVTHSYLLTILTYWKPEVGFFHLIAQPDQSQRLEDMPWHIRDVMTFNSAAMVTLCLPRSCQVTLFNINQVSMFIRVVAWFYLPIRTDLPPFGCRKWFQQNVRFHRHLQTSMLLPRGSLVSHNKTRAGRRCHLPHHVRGHEGPVSASLFYLCSGCRQTAELRTTTETWRAI